MSILKIIFFFFLILFLVGVVRIAIVLFKFNRFVKKTRGASEKTESAKKPDGKRSYSKENNTITLGKDDYHVE